VITSAVAVEQPLAAAIKTAVVTVAASVVGGQLTLEGKSYIPGLAVHEQWPLGSAVAAGPAAVGPAAGPFELGGTATSADIEGSRQRQ